MMIAMQMTLKKSLIKHFKADVILGNAKGLEHFKAVKDAAKERVYKESKGCPTHWSVLRFVIEVLILKAKYGWSDSSFNDLLKLLSWLLPKPNFVPTNTYQVKKVISPLTMGVERIHACPNHCTLCRGLFEKLEKCPTCGASRYKWNDIYNDEDRASSNAKKRKKKGAKTYAPDPTEEADNTCLGINENKRRIPALVMCYLNPIDCLRRMLANPREAKLMRWWHDERTDDEGKLTQPANGTQWTKFDDMYPEFVKDPRNVRFAHGMNPLGERKSTHSTWPVILTIYNVPTWLCQTRKYLLLCILIQGPKQSGIDIGVFLEPLMEDMAKL
jgi:hypothetical protein